MGYAAQGQEAVTGRAELRMQAVWVRAMHLTTVLCCLAVTCRMADSTGERSRNGPYLAYYQQIQAHGAEGQYSEIGKKGW